MPDDNNGDSPIVKALLDLRVQAEAGVRLREDELTEAQRLLDVAKSRYVALSEALATVRTLERK